MKKARLLKVQKREEYEKARSSTSRTEEEQPTAGGRTLEKKRRVEEEALQKVLQKLHYNFKFNFNRVKDCTNTHTLEFIDLVYWASKW